MRWLKRQILALPLLAAAVAPAAAQDATWLLNPGSGDFNTAANWTPATVPTGTAFFGPSNVTALSFSVFSTTVGGFTFNVGASAYTFVVTNFRQLQFNGAGIVINGGSATITNNAAGGSLQFFNASTAGSATITNNASNVFFSNTSTAGNATIINNGSVTFFDSSSAGSATIAITNNGFIAGMTFAGTSTAGNAIITNDGLLDFRIASTAGNATIINNLGVTFFNTSTAGSANITNTGTLRFRNTSTAGGAAITNNNALAVVDISNSTGPANDGKLTAGSIAGNGLFYLGARELTVGGNNQSTTVSGVISDCGATGLACVNAGAVGGALVKAGTGTLILTGANTYTGGTTVNAGTLQLGTAGTQTTIVGAVTNNAVLDVVNANTAGVTTLVNNGALRTNANVVTATGNITFNAGSQWSLTITPAGGARIVAGSATLNGGTLNITGNGTFTFGTNYTLLTTNGGNVTGTFTGVTFTGTTVNTRNPHLTYDANNVYLTFDPNSIVTLLPPNASANQINVAAAIDRFVLGGGNLGDFASLFNLTQQGLLTALSQLSGENANGLSLAAFQAMGQFLGVMLDPFADNRFGGTNGLALPFGPGAADLPPEIAAAYAALMPVKAAPSARANAWTVWGSAFGGYNKVRGDATVGSNDATARGFGFAAGADYRYGPNTILGFALAGGGTSWGLANSLGTGKSDAFQIGIYGSHRFGAAYVSGALAYSHHWVDTERRVFLPATSQLNASFGANVFGGRIETGYRLAMRSVGVTPYAALQAVSVRAPAYSETVTTGAAFALSYNSRTATTTRSELGAWFDLTRLLGSSVIALRTRAAWAHNWFSDPSVSAIFLTLPGTNFTVNGAAPARDAALLSAAAEWRLRANLALLARFDSEFGNRSQTYAGTATIRYAW